MSQAPKFDALLRGLKNEIDPNEALEIICHVCSCKKSDIFLNAEIPLDKREYAEILRIAFERKTGKPLAYCTNSAYFYEREFFVDENVLIPRFDTEILIERVLKNESEEPKTVLELGTGSGIIPEILQNKRPSWNFVSTDISLNALHVAQKNQKTHGKVLFVNCDKFAAISGENQFDLIVSNPPYIESATIKTLDESVRDFEPILALDGGENGLSFYEYIAKNARSLLKKSGRVYMEIGFNQAKSVPEIFEKSGFSDVSLTKDFGQNPRVISAVLAKR